VVEDCFSLSTAPFIVYGSHGEVIGPIWMTAADIVFSSSQRELHHENLPVFSPQNMVVPQKGNGPSLLAKNPEIQNH